MHAIHHSLQTRSGPWPFLDPKSNQSRLATARNIDSASLRDPQLRQNAPRLIGRVDGLTVDRQDHIASCQISHVGWTVDRNLMNQRAIGTVQVQILGQAGCQIL